jgi:hypothetical protein
MAKKKLSRDQKRKAKIAKKANRHEPHLDLAYKGNKYKTDELTPVFFEAELGIHQADVATNRALTDQTVAKALTTLILQMREGPLPNLPKTLPLGETEESVQDLIIFNIRHNWNDLFETAPRRGKETLIGVLRTLLGSIQTWRTPSPQSRGYLAFVEGFINKAGASVRRVVDDADEQEDSWVTDEDEATDAEELLAMGQAWYQAVDELAAEDFHDLAENMLETGQAEEVAEVCQHLIGEAGECEALPKWMAWSLRAHEVMRQSNREDVPRPAPASPTQSRHQDTGAPVSLWTPPEENP